MELTFEQWMLKVDRHLASICGLTHMDLEDWTYRDAFDDGASPKEAAQDALDYCGFYDFVENF